MWAWQSQAPRRVLESYRWPILCPRGSWRRFVMGLLCKRCGSEEHVKNGLMRGQQRYLCKGCGLNFTDTPPTRQAAGPEGGCRAALCQRLVDEPHRQAPGCLNTHHPGLARAVRPGLRAEARAGGPGRGDRTRRDGALPEKKSEPLWVWKAWDRATGQLVDWECGGRAKVTCERLIARLKRW